MILELHHWHPKRARGNAWDWVQFFSFTLLSYFYYHCLSKNSKEPNYRGLDVKEQKTLRKTFVGRLTFKMHQRVNLDGLQIAKGFFGQIFHCPINLLWHQMALLGNSSYNPDVHGCLLTEKRYVIMVIGCKVSCGYYEVWFRKIIDIQVLQQATKTTGSFFCRNAMKKWNHFPNP